MTTWLIILAAIGAVAFTAFWCVQFIDLMQWQRDAFPSPRDKTVWIIGFLFTPLITPPAWVMFKRLGADSPDSNAK